MTKMLFPVIAGCFIAFVPQAKAERLQQSEAGGIGVDASRAFLVAGGGFVVAPAAIQSWAQQGSAGSGRSAAANQAAEAASGFAVEQEDAQTGAESAQAPAGSSLAGCSNKLAQTLYRAGFRGSNLREAWAIAMRESSGQGDLGPGNPHFNGYDWGLFQFNKPSWGKESWWNDQKMVDADYNASIAYKISKGGTYWLPWGLTGDGQPSPSLYKNVGWTDQQVQDWIVEPFQRYSAQFAGLPSACKG